MLSAYAPRDLLHEQKEKNLLPQCQEAAQLSDPDPVGSSCCPESPKSALCFSLLPCQVPPQSFPVIQDITLFLLPLNSPVSTQHILVGSFLPQQYQRGRTQALLLPTHYNAYRNSTHGVLQAMAQTAGKRLGCLLACSLRTKIEEPFQHGHCHHLRGTGTRLWRAHAPRLNAAPTKQMNFKDVIRCLHKGVFFSDKWYQAPGSFCSYS